MVSRERLVCLELRVRREIKVSVELRVKRALLDPLVSLDLLVCVDLWDQSVALEWLARSDLLASKAPVVLRETRETVVSVDPRVSVVRRACQVPVDHVVTKVTKVFVAHLANLVLVVFLVSKERVEMLVRWVLAELVGSLVSKECLVPLESVA